MHSKELQRSDINTVNYMIKRIRKEIEEQQKIHRLYLYSSGFFVILYLYSCLCSGSVSFCKL